MDVLLKPEIILAPRARIKSVALYPLIPEINKLAPDDEKLSRWSN